MNQAEISAVFSNLGLPLVDKGIEDILQSKKQMMRDIYQTNPENIYRVTVSNGTGKNVKHANLERSSY